MSKQGTMRVQGKTSLWFAKLSQWLGRGGG